MATATKMKDPLFGSFENRIEGFGRVDVDLPSGKLLYAVVNPLMAGKLFADRHIGLQLGSHDASLGRNRLFEVGRQDSVAVIGNQSGSNRALAADGHVNTGFLGGFAPGMLHPLLKPRFAAKTLFVQLNDTVQRPQGSRMRSHHSPNGMTDLPSCLLIDSHSLGHENRRDTFTGVDHEVHGQQPDSKWQLGTVHGRFEGHRELPVAVAVFIQSGASRGP